MTKSNKSNRSNGSAEQSAPFDRVGLCKTCRYVRLVSNARGGVFYLCQLSESDARFPKYPRLPVIRCAGYEKADK